MDYSTIATEVNKALSDIETSSKEIGDIPFGSVWSGDAFNTQSNNLNKTAEKLKNEIAYVQTYITALNTLQEYKNTKDSIAALRSQYYQLADIKENYAARANLSREIFSLENKNITTKSTIKNLLNSINGVSPELSKVVYQAQEDYKDYAILVNDLYNINKGGNLALIGSDDSLFNYVSEEDVKNHIDSIKSQYTGRAATVNCAIGLMSLAAEQGIIINYKENDSNPSSNFQNLSLSDVVNGSDCSSFISWAVNQGADDTFATQFTGEFESLGRQINFAEAKPGDIISSSGSHIGLIVANYPEEGYFLVAEEDETKHGLVVQRKEYSTLNNFTARDLSEVYDKDKQS